MDFGIRELLFFIGLVFIAGILFDGLRRMRKSKGELYGLPPDYDQIEIGRNGPDDPQFHKEGQSADVIDLRSDAQRAAGDFNANLEKGRGADEMVQQGRSTAAVTSGSNTEAVASAEASEQLATKSDRQQQVFEDDYYNDELPNGGARRVETSKSESSSTSDAFSSSTSMPLSTVSSDKNEPTVSLEGVTLDKVDSHETVNEIVNDEIVTESDKEVTDETVEEPTFDDESLGVQGPQAPSDVIIFNIVAKDNGAFSGQSLLKAVEMCQMELGDMNIFHRYEGNPRELLFSMANLVEPGTFDLDTMHDFKSPGVCLFMQLPGPKRSIVALERMVEVARKLAIKLGAEMRDENHSVITPQTIEHYRQRVMEFERKRRTRRYAEMAH